jgi:flagellar M-ring protein FliF
MRGSRRLDRNQVLAIQHMVAAAVPGLQPNLVSIVDDKGTLLARGANKDDLQGVASTADEMRIGYETRLARTIEELIERSVGPGNVRAEVSADMDFDRVTENAEIYDPDGQVVRSTQTVEESSNYDPDGQVVRSTQTVEESSNALDGQVPPPVTVGNNLPDAGLPQLGDGTSSSNRTARTEETVNYEITRTVKTHVRESGLVRRLSVAVLVNGTMTTGTDGEPFYQPRSDEEMQQITALARSAVGLNEERGDTLQIVNLRFADVENPLASVADTGLLGFSKVELMRIAEILVLGVVGILVLLLVVRPVVSRLLEAAPAASQGGGGLLPDMSAAQPALAGPGALIGAELPGGAVGAPAGTAAALAQPAGTALLDEDMPSEVDAMIDLNKVEGRVRASSIRKIGEIVEKHPEEAVAIVRNWLYQQD